MGMLSQMATFVRVVDAGSLSAAARLLRLSLPAVSRQLRALETELGGVPLLIRSSRGMQMTGAGQRFYSEAVSILGSVDRARAKVKDVDELAGRLTVSVAISVGLEIIVPRLTDFLAAHRSRIVYGQPAQPCPSQRPGSRKNMRFQPCQPPARCQGRGNSDRMA